MVLEQYYENSIPGLEHLHDTKTAAGDVYIKKIFLRI